MICGKLRTCVENEQNGKTIKECDNRNRSNCIESSDNRSIVKCEENGKKYLLDNSNRNHVISYKMDGGVIVVDRTVPEGMGKCDYLFIVNSQEASAILIELKGENVLKSVKQLHNTLVLFKDFFHTFSHVYGRAVVASSTPNLKASAEYVKLAKLIYDVYQGNIKIVERQLREKDTDLDKA